MSQEMTNIHQGLFRGGMLPTVMYANMTSDTNFKGYYLHRHEDLCEIVYICDGLGHFVIDNQYYEATKGDILIYNKNVLHHEIADQEYPLKKIVCAVSNVCIVGLEDDYIIPPYMSPVIHVRDDKAHSFEFYFQSIYRECVDRAEGYKAVCQYLAGVLLTKIARLVSETQQKVIVDEAQTLALKIKQYIDENYTQEITLNSIAEKFYISPYYLAHILKDETGFSPIRYTMNRRIGEAQKLLFDTDLPITTISRMVGYENTNYFNNLFKKHLGVSPGRFREESTSNFHRVEKPQEETEE